MIYKTKDNSTAGTALISAIKIKKLIYSNFKTSISNVPLFPCSFEEIEFSVPPGIVGHQVSVKHN